MMMVLMMFDDDPWYMHIGQWHLYEAINEYAFTIFEFINYIHSLLEELEKDLN